MKTALTDIKSKATEVIDNVNGGIAAPVVMYFLGVPAVLCVLAWLFFFRGG